MKQAVSPWFRAREWAGSIGGFLVVLTALVAVDDRVAHNVRALFHKGPGGEVAAIGDRLAVLGQVILQAARDQSIDHAPMLMFTVVAIVLVFFMVRT